LAVWQCICYFGGYNIKRYNMKKHLIILLAALALAGCQKECGTGYEGENCQEQWSDKYSRSWAGTVNCTNPNYSGQVQTSWQDAGATRLHIDGSYFAELETSYSLLIAPQTYQVNGTEYTVSGYGTLATDGRMYLFTSTRTANGGSQACNFELN
jgi:hypothetical protein